MTARAPQLVVDHGPEEGRREPASTLVDHVWTVIEGRWTAAAVAAVCIAAAGAYLFVAKPAYQSNALVQVEDRSKTIAVLKDLNTMFEEKTPSESEIEVIRSRTLLTEVVEQLDLDVEARPRRFPLIGDPIARRYRGEGLAAPLLGIARYGWGGETIQVRHLEVSDDLLEDPMTLIALGDGRYRLSAAGGWLEFEGAVGVAAEGSNGARRVGLVVSELIARPGTQFRLKKHRKSDVVEWLQSNLRVIEKGKKTGVLLVELEGADPQRVAATVSAIADTYVRKNVEQRTSEATRSLDFVETQLPLLKANLDAAESALNIFKQGARIIDPTREAEALLARSSEVEKALSELDLQRSELRQRFTDSHPNLLSLASKAATLRAERAGIGARLRVLREAEGDSSRLLQNVKVSAEMYQLLLNKAQELRVVKSGAIGNIRVLDQAQVPLRPSWPRTGAVVAIALFLGLCGGIAATFVRRALDQRTQDAEEIETRAGVQVIATIPHSSLQSALARAARRHRGGPAQVLSAVDSGDQAIESLRSLRTSLQFALLGAQNNIVVVFSPTEGAGKSFVASNLAHVFAAAGARVLLVDGDLRRGMIHRQFGIDRSPGFSDVVTSGVPLDQAIHATPEGRLHVLPTGSIPRNPAELLSGPAMERTLKDASQRFDVVIIDTAPVLAVTDPLLLARFASVNLLVLRARHHPIREIALTLKRFAQSGLKVQGAVLNDLSASRGHYGKSGYEYRRAAG